MMATKTKPARIVALVLGAIVMAAAGAGGMYFYMRGRDGSRTAPVMAAPVPSGERPHEIAITITPEAVARAGIRTARPTLGNVGATITAPGVVEPNAYHQVVVRSVAPGQVRSVVVDLGSSVKRGDLLATIHTPDLADTARTFLSMQSELEAAHQRLNRLEGLVKIGAASRQELEIAKAEHTRHATDVDSARAKLTLLGLTADQLSSLTESSVIDPMVRIAAPRDGIVTARSVNPGTNIDGSADLFTVGDLDSVWIVANVYERDLERVPRGTAASITTAAGRTWTGRVTYVDPQLAPDTRTAKARIEVANADHVLKFAMYVDVVFSPATSAKGLLIPRSAVQTIGSLTVVYVADAQHTGRYIERPVVLGQGAAERVQVLAGLTEQDDVVVDGSFTLRAERDRLGR